MIGTGAVAVDRIAAGPWAQNCYVVAAAGDAVVIDPGGQAERIVESIGAGRLRLHAVLATHGHHDHVGALPAVVEAYEVPFGIHSGDARVLGRVNFSRFAFHGLEPIEIPPVGIDLAAATALCFGALEVSVVRTPGHTPGGVCFEAGGELFTGDTLLAADPADPSLPESDPELLRESVRHLAEAYPPETAIHPGHGDPTVLSHAVAAAEAPG